MRRLVLLLVSLLPPCTPQLDPDTPLLSAWLTPKGEGVSQQCLQASQEFITRRDAELLSLTLGEMVETPWALRMVDSAGLFPGSGVLQGNIFLPGSMEGCLSSVKEGEVMLGEEGEIISWAPQFCMVTTCLEETGGCDAVTGNIGGTDRDASGSNQPLREESVRSFLDGLHSNRSLAARGLLPSVFVSEVPMGLYAFYVGMTRFGKCLPSACTREDVKQGFDNFILSNWDEELTNLGLPPPLTQAINCHTKDEVIPPLTPGDWIMIAVIIIFGVFLIIGSSIDMFIRYFPKTFPFLNSSGLVCQIFLGFSAITNIAGVMDVNKPKEGSIECLNGIRFAADQTPSNICRTKP